VKWYLNFRRMAPQIQKAFVDLLGLIRMPEYNVEGHLQTLDAVDIASVHHCCKYHWLIILLSS
jgi:hypothetical protein